jgi:glycosyltransferase involved in cell wall biosynthesis
MRIAFYAPMKAPTHPVPSGDRRMARLLQAALAAAGHEVRLASEFRSYDGVGSPERQRRLEAEGTAEAQRLLARYAAEPAERPRLWFTYHLYHKAPDWLGPPVAAALGIPYAVAEPSYAPKRANGPWDLGHRAVARALGRADAAFCLTRLDMACVAPLLAGPERLRYLPPFVDVPAAGAADCASARAALAARLGLDAAPAWLVAVGMMRAGDKLESYRRLGVALARLTAPDWRLLVVGDGPARPEVEAALAPIARRVGYAGALAPRALAAALAAADVCVWPAANEAYGMALLEAQASGLPVVAGNERGVPDVVGDGVTGLLCPPGDAAAFAAAVDRLLIDAGLRRRLGEAARARVAAERSVAATAARLAPMLELLAP